MTTTALTFLSLLLLASTVSADVSVNMVDLLWSRTSHGQPFMWNRNRSRASMQSASTSGFKVIRFAASGYWPVDHQMWINETTRPLFYSALDSVFEDASTFDVQLIPSMMWQVFTFVDVCNEPMSQLMRNTSSCSFNLTHKYFTAIIERYSTKFSKNIYAWEIGNEMNLEVDLSSPGTVAPQMGTPAKRTSLDNFTTADMQSFQSHVLGWIHSLHPAAKVSSGHAIPRQGAWHLRQSYYSKHRDWTHDTQQQYIETMMDQNIGFDLVSVHLYPSADLHRFNLSPSELFQYTVNQMKQRNRTMFLGEFGVHLPDRHNKLSPIYGFTKKMVEIVKNEDVLANYWIWEFPNQNDSFSIYPGLDDDTIRVLQSGNSE